MSPPPIASLWVGARLSWVEQLCLKSWQDAGHAVTLFTLGDVAGLPTGIARARAQDILPPPFAFEPDPRHRIATYSDLFRLKLFEKTDHIWVDCDAYGLRPLEGLGAAIFGWGPKRVLTGVLRLPSSSPALALMSDFVSRRCPIQPWRNPAYRARRARWCEEGRAWGIEDLPWGCAGPQLLHWALTQTGEIAHALPLEAFYPVVTEAPMALHQRPPPIQALEAACVYSIHIFGAQRIALAAHNGGLPFAGSYLAEICARHGIAPGQAPIETPPMAG
ncbi:MAG: hypothetical protein AAF841_10785 [Pseudomonadota bacterium]